MKKAGNFLSLSRILSYASIVVLLVVMGLSYACSDDKDDTCKTCTNEKGEKEEFCGSELEDIEKLPGSNCK
ncbi:MAG: hypothetical protein LBQ60_22290 [Bacteroidales bacterium]|jgi:hypothetical protein|nr:hypothetical protein [Bacteroidales bacterium]